MPKAMNHPSLNGRKSLDQESSNSVRNQCEEEEEESQSNSCIVLQVSGSIPSSKVKNHGSLKRSHPQMNQQHKVRSLEASNAMILRDKASLEPSESQEICGVDRRDGVSLSPISSSGSAPSASPDVLIELIGENRLLKLRTNMINQQTIFTAQVFELHRLIEVQKLLAGSPGLVLDKSFNMKKPVPVKQSSSSVLEQSCLVNPNNQNSHRFRATIEFSDKKMIKKLPLPPVSRKRVTQISDPLAANRKPSPWSSQDPANNWLVPVMSSSSRELVRKLYSRPMYGHSVISVASGYPGYFAQNEMQVPDSSKSSSPAEQMDAFSQTQSSLSISSDTKEPQASKGSDGQATTAKPDLLQLFPTEPTCQHAETDENEQRPQNAIKVVPHPPRLASESAAKIYRFIQEERML